MFKKTLSFLGLIRVAYSALLILALTGCQSTPPLPRADLSEPGWSVCQGQAVWRARRGGPEIAGEILVATNRNGQTLVQFSKTPFPLVVAQTTTNRWQVEAPTRNKRYAGSGRAPGRLVWFELPRAWSGTPLPKPWSWRNSESDWRLENRSTGESLEGYFNQ